jgi:hypothetical protein
MNTLRKPSGKKQSPVAPVADGPGRILVYVFCNGFQPNPAILGTATTTWLSQKFGNLPAELPKVLAALDAAPRFAFRLPPVPSDSWPEVANLTILPKLDALHPNRGRQVLVFARRGSSDPNMFDALLAVIFGVDEDDILKAERLRAGKEL